MTTFNTGNPLGSMDPRDLFDNSKNLDHAANSQTAEEWDDRFGRSRKTWHGIEKQAGIDVVSAATAAAALATTQAEEFRDQAESARDEAIAAASASGDFIFAKDLAAMQAKLPQPDGKIIEVASDGDHDGARTRYIVEAGAPIFVINLDRMRVDLAGENGVSHVGNSGESLDQTMDRMNSASGGAYRRSVLIDLPLQFPDYMQILAENGHDNSTGFMYPGSFAIDEIAREVFVVMGCSSTKPNPSEYIIVFDLDTKAYKGYMTAVLSIGEGIEVTYGYGMRKLFVADRQLGGLYEYDIPVKSTYQENDLSHPVVRQVGLYNQFSFNEASGIWAFEQKEPSVGQNIDRGTLALFDKDFNSIGTIAMDVQASGYVTPTTNAYAANWPKRQGFALGNGLIATSHGASHDTGAQGGEPTYFQGCRLLDGGGSVVLRDSMCRPHEFKKILHSIVGGTVPTRIENEGCKFLKNGELVALYVYRTRYSSIAEKTSGGLLLVKEFTLSGEATDFSGAASPFKDWGSFRFDVGVFPRTLGGYVNPVTGAKFTNLNEVCDYLALTNRKMFSFYSSTYTLNGFDGNSIPGAVFVRITNLNGLTFFVEHHSTFSDRCDIYYAGGPAGSMRMRTAIGGRFRELIVDAGIKGEGQKLARITVPSYAGDARRILMLDMQANAGSTNVFIGGGSASFDAATSVQFVTAENTGVAGGLTRWIVNDKGAFRPWLDNAYQIGYSDFRVKDLFLANAPTVSSDRRLKQQQRGLTVSERAAAAEIRSLPCAYKMSDAVQQKGADNARWHYGMMAQDLIDVLERHGVDWTQCGFICFDRWEDEYVEHDDLYQDSEIVGEDGVPLKILIKAAYAERVREAGERYSIRYQELSMFLLAASV